MKRRILVLLAATIAAAGLSIGRPDAAHAQGGANTAIAVNTKDGSSLFKVSFAIRHVMSDVVDQTNAAVAVSSCTNCQTVAIAFEIVLVEDNASTVAPTNVAIAMNIDCTLCVTVADAYQFVFSTGGVVHFDAEGNKTMAQIKHELEQLKHDNLTLDELQAKLDAIQQEVLDVLQNHLVAVGSPDDSSASSQPASTSTSTPTTTTTPTTTSPTTQATTTQPTTTAVTTTTVP